ncbi:response regulator [Cereibacter sphaeroides]|uniref:ATP-binding protein n=1 Tax=Cereibacter sphaeroides TaxID=1063 RepID=UPI001F2BB264|nr:ATP-binding protein [Cereibacter sphaeroides]MCE6950305.1 response regulator [Cereibacter sphaeroides]
MPARRFDKQFQFVFTVLSGLTLLVGLTSIGINRALIKSHEAVLNQSIAMIERAERIGSEAEAARGLVVPLAAAGSAAEADRASAALVAQIDGMEAGISDLRRFLNVGEAAPLRVPEASRVVSEMTVAVAQALSLAAALRDEQDRLFPAAPRLAELIAAQTDLARLRVVAGVWELYSAAPGTDLRPGLDGLADRDFFAFERIGELAEATSTLGRLIRQISAAEDESQIAGLRDALADALSLAQARLRFLPAPSAAAKAGQDLALYGRAGEPDGLADLQLDLLDVRSKLRALSDRLDRDLDALAAEAVARRDAARARMREQVAEAGRRAGLLSVALVAALALALLVAVALWFYARRRIVSRLGAVSERIVAVARGDATVPMAISGHDEVGRLEKAVNVLRRRMQEAARLRESLEAAVRARTADVVAEMELANEARAEAEEASGARTRFLARMSHEIRTPLNGVLGMLHLLKAEEADPDRRLRLTTAVASAEDLRALTDDILTFSSGEDGSPASAHAPFDPAQLARHLGEHLRALAVEKGLRAEVTIAPDLPPAVTGEALRIRQVVGNLISNAVKYTDAGVVRLEVRRSGSGELTFAVTDTGLGMTAEETVRAFDIYGRTDAARRRGIRGVGLGLAIARQLTDAMGGELRVSSEPGRGSRFSLSLRLPPADPADLPRDEALPGVAAAGTVLIVDDHRVNRLVARGYLERMGCSVTEAATGTEALERAAANRFDAILIDLDLPDLHGTEVIARLDLKGARLAVLTADLVADTAETRARLGVDHVLTKPLSPRALLSVLARPDGPPEALPGETEAILRQDRAELGEVLTAEAVAAYLADLPALVTRIREATNAEERRRAAHKLKGASANFALHGLCARLRRIEVGEAAAVEALDAEVEAAERTLRAAAAAAGVQLPDEAAKL